MPAAHEALDGENRVLGIGDLLMLGGLPNQTLALFGERDDRRRQAAALGVDQHLGLIAFHDGDHAVGRAEVDSNDFCHMTNSLNDVPAQEETPMRTPTSSQTLCHASQSTTICNYSKDSRLQTSFEWLSGPSAQREMPIRQFIPIRCQYGNGPGASAKRQTDALSPIS